MRLSALAVLLLPAFCAADQMTIQAFDDSLRATQSELIREHPESRTDLDVRFNEVHDSFHVVQNGRHLERPGSGADRVTREYWTSLTQSIDARLDLAEAYRRRAPPEEIRRLEENARRLIRGAQDNPLLERYRDAAMRHPPSAGNPEVNLPGRVRQEEYRRFIGRNPDRPEPHLYAGNSELASGSPQAAKSYANNAIAVDPRNSDAYSLRAAAEMDMRNYRAAATDARTALDLNPEDQRAKAVLMLAHDTVAGSYGVSKLEKKKSEPSDDGSGVLGLGGSGARALSPSVSQSSLQAEVLGRGAERSVSMGDYNLAVSQASRALDLDPGHANYLGIRAMAHAKAGRNEEALRDADDALKEDPNNVAALNARARALNGSGRYNDALAASDAALRSNPRNSYAYYMRAMALEAMKDRKGMVEALEQAANLNARYRDAADASRIAPAEQELGFLFPEENLAQAKALLAAKAEEAQPQRKLPSLVATVIGGCLLLFGALHWLLPLVAPGIGSPLSALRRTGPAVGRSETVAGLPDMPPLEFEGPSPQAPRPGFHRTTGSSQGTVLRGQYRRLGQIGGSVHGAVYEGVDLALARRVAIRKLRAEMRADDRERILTPARQAASLKHPGVALLYAVLEEGEALYLISEFAEGRTLRDALAAQGPLSGEEAVPLFRRVAEALDYAHGRGVVHGAVKASNIMIGPAGTPKLVDFGLSRGPADFAADRYAFAACMREAIAGLPPTQLDAIDEALSHSAGQWLSASQVVGIVEENIRAAS